MKRIFLLALLFVFIFPLEPKAAEEVSVKEAAVATGIKNLAPEGVAETFPSNVGKLYCYSLIMNGQGASVIHKWYHKEDLRAAIPLAIKYPSHRTYSEKRIFPGGKGDWRVEITKEDGTILKTVKFKVE
ncbi:MAG: DUF2914 domain-containing protein [Thermodesulfobacteriota bacterium]